MQKLASMVDTKQEDYITNTFLSTLINITVVKAVEENINKVTSQISFI